MAEDGSHAPGALWLLACHAAVVTAPIGLAMERVALSPAAAHDAGTIRAVGHGSTGLLHGLDAALAAWFTVVPLGTRASGAAWASAVMAGVAALAMFEIARTWGMGGTRLGLGLAAIVSIAGACSRPWQVEAIGVGSSAAPALGALIATLWAVKREALTAERAPVFVFLTAVTGSFDWAAGLALAVVGGVCAGIGWWSRRTADSGQRTADGGQRTADSGQRTADSGQRSADSGQRTADSGRRAAWSTIGAALLLGLLPIGIALATRWVAPERSMSGGLFEAIAPEHGVAMHRAVARVEWGALVGVAAGAGAAIGLFRAETRRVTAILATWAALAAGAAVLRLPVGPSRYGAVVLVGTGAAYILAGRAFHAAVSWIARADIPFARASGAMVLVLLLALPAKNADESLTGGDPMLEMASAAWAESACGPLAPGSVILLSDARLERRLLAARAASELRADLLLVPLFDPRGARAARALASEPLLTPLYRDAIVSGAPEEVSLAKFAEARPLVFMFEARHERALARHLVPSGLFMRFMPEPRGRTERRAGLEEFLAPRAEIARTSMSRGRDPEILEVTTRLLRARAIALAAADDKEVVSRALDDLRHFSPEDPMIQTLIRRMLTSKGVIDLKELAP